MGRDRRRQPQRIPITRNIGNSARIRKIIDDQHYMLDIGSRVGSPVIGFYIGSLVLIEGERVLATWREESELWEIIGPIRQQPAAPSGVNLAILETPVAGEKLELVRWTAADGFTDQIFGATDPVGLGLGIEFSPNGIYIATIDQNNTLRVYGLDGIVIDSASLSGTFSTTFCVWSPDGAFILVSHDETGGDDKYASIFAWDGTTLTLIDDMLGDSGSIDGRGVAWNLDGTVVFFSTSTGGADVEAFSFDGATAVNITSENQSLVNPHSMELSKDGAYLFTAELSAIGNRGLGAALWDGATLGATIYATSPTADNVHDLEVSPDGAFVAVGLTASPFLRVYPWAPGVWGAGISPAGGDIPAGIVRGVSWHPDGGHLFACWDNGFSNVPYYAVWDFDGAVLDNKQDGISPGVGVTKDGFGLSFSKAEGAALPTEQLDASEITYTPADDTDWVTVPDDVAEALDELADRLTGLSRIIDLPLNSFVAHTGSPTYAQVGTNMHAWELDAAADELVVYSFTIPPQYVSGGFFRVRYVMASATTNEVVVSADALAVAEGEDFDAAGTAATVTDTVQGVADDLGVVDVTPAVTYAVGDRVRAIVGRLGSDGSDDAAGDMWLVGVEFRYTAAL